ncbi:hypothetical protein KCMC57_up08610 [Kitasatospora sp. CMC57]|uniref:Uncharacterized protein n=1 Tax=Kitasatospora sp. CMC57 TaxID=3231513 RepID=A0AB33JT72_9ACTN
MALLRHRAARLLRLLYVLLLLRLLLLTVLGLLGLLRIPRLLRLSVAVLALLRVTLWLLLWLTVRAGLLRPRLLLLLRVPLLAGAVLVLGVLRLLPLPARGSAGSGIARLPRPHALGLVAPAQISHRSP